MLPGALVASPSAQQPAVGRGDCHDLAAVRADHHGAGLAAVLPHHADVAGAVAEALELVMTHELLPARIAHDDAAGLIDQGATTFLDLAALTAEVLEALRSHQGCARRNRRELLG